MILDHVGFGFADYARAKAFYAKALAPLGIGLLMEVTSEQTGEPVVAGFGRDKPELWIAVGATTTPGVHLAFRATDRAQVRAFYEAAIAAGAKDNGPPGLRPHYHPNYYGAFCIDPEGHNIEAVCHVPEQAGARVSSAG